tara:strand:+ start:14133 stop:15611 length:1479 start_codon:yes stop_codon:yes gene_type:complete
MSRHTKGHTNPESYRFFEGSVHDSFSFFINNLTDSYYSNLLNVVTTGTFKAVCLSGITTGNNTGTGTHPLDGYRNDDTGHFYLIVKPLTDFGNILPDPLNYKGDKYALLRLVESYGSVYLARSSYDYSSISPVSFGQIIDCNFLRGSAARSDFRDLSFSEPLVSEYDQRYLDLISESFDIDVTTLDSYRKGSPFVLGADTTMTTQEYTDRGLCSNVQGELKNVEYVVIHYSAAFGSKKAVLKSENENTKYGYHFMVDRDGTFFESAPTDTLIYHAAGNNVVKNENSVGLCIMNVGYARTGVPAKSNWETGVFPNQPPESKATRLKNGKVSSSGKDGKWEPYTEKSLKSSAILVARVCRDFNLNPFSAVVGHSDIQNNKQDPGPAFDMAKFRNMVLAEMSNMGVENLPYSDSGIEVDEFGDPILESDTTEEEAYQAPDIGSSVADLQTKYDGKTMYFIPGTGAMKGTFLVEDGAFYFSYNDDEDVMRKLRVYK